MELEVPQGSIYGVLGSNGAGKTTLIRMLVGLLRPSFGSVEVLGLNPIRERYELRKRIGYMPQSTALYENLSVRDNIVFIGKAHLIPNLREKVDQIIEFVGLTTRARDPVNNLSGGMKKRVSLGCALINDPEIFFLDEPTASVDPHLKRKSWDLFRKLAANGATLLISTHLMDEALLCDKLAIMSKGEIVLVEKPQTILQQGVLSISMTKKNQIFTELVSANPKAVAAKLHDYGLATEIQSVQIGHPNLEDIVLQIIDSQNR